MRTKDADNKPKKRKDLNNAELLFFNFVRSYETRENIVSCGEAQEKEKGA